MKKLNNKGFAISTLLYGLLLVVFLVITLLMSVMATNRKNTKDLVEKIEADLNRYEKTTTTMIATEDDTAQIFTVPDGQAGWYKIELWGAKGDTSDPDEESIGKGAYASSLVQLHNNDKIYFFLGTKDYTYNHAVVRLDASNNFATSDFDDIFIVAAGGKRTGAGLSATGFEDVFDTDGVTLLGKEKYDDGRSYNTQSTVLNYNTENFYIKNEMIISGVSSEEKAIAKIQKISDPSSVSKTITSDTIPTANYYIALNYLYNESFITNNTSTTPSAIEYKLFNGSTAQKWLIEAIDSSTYKIVSLKDSKALKFDGSILTTDDYDGSDAFKWEIKHYSGEIYNIKKSATTLYLGVTNLGKSGILEYSLTDSEEGAEITFINADY